MLSIGNPGTGKSSVNILSTAATAVAVILVLICMSISPLCPSQLQPHPAPQMPLPCSFFSAAAGIFFSTAFPPPRPSCSSFWTQLHGHLLREASWSPTLIQKNPNLPAQCSIPCMKAMSSKKEVRFHLIPHWRAFRDVQEPSGRAEW